MSRILNRPMFRGGGKVSSYGKGIASGLTSKPKGYAGGGQIGGGSIYGELMPDGRYGFANPSTYAQNYNNINFKNVADTVKNTGANVVQAAKDKISQGGGKTKNFYNKSKNFLKSKNFSEKGIMKGLKKYGTKGLKVGSNLATGIGSRFPIASLVGKRASPYYAMYKASEVTPVDEKYDISRYKDNLFAPLQLGESAKEGMDKKALRNTEQASNPNNFYRYDPSMYGPREDHPDYDASKIRYNPFSDDKGAADTPIRYNKDGEIIRYNDATSMFGLKTVPASLDQKERTDEPPFVTPPPEEILPPELTVKEQVNKDKALFAELLGGDKAKGKDVSDMLLRFAGSGGDTVGEKFQQYIANEAQAGPSRTEKINQAAASLAINDYVAGKRSKENMEMMIKKTKFGVDYTLDAREAREDIKSMEWGDALTSYAKNVTGGKKSRNDPAVIKGVLSIQMEGTPVNIKTFSNKSKNEIGNLDATEFDIGINIVSYKGGRIIVERVGDIVTEVKGLPIT